MNTTTTESKDVLRLFMEANQRSVDAEGIRIPHAIARTGEGLTMIALAMHGEDTALQIYRAIASILVRDRPDELVFGTDRYTKPGQGVATADCLSVHHWNGRAWRFGVIPYQYSPPIWGPIDWSNQWWIEMLRKETCSAFARLAARPGVTPSPAMVSPIPFDRMNGMEVGS